MGELGLQGNVRGPQFFANKHYIQLCTPDKQAYQPAPYCAKPLSAKGDCSTRPGYDMLAQGTGMVIVKRSNCLAWWQTKIATRLCGLDRILKSYCYGKDFFGMLGFKPPALDASSAARTGPSPSAATREEHAKPKAIHEIWSIFLVSPKHMDLM